VVIGDVGQHNWLGGSSTGMGTDVDTSVLFFQRPDGPAWMGFAINFPLPAAQDLDTSGFGAIHHGTILIVQYGFEALTNTLIVDPGTGQIVAAPFYTLVVQFPRDTVWKILEVTEERKPLLPTELSDNLKGKCCLLSAQAKNPTDIRVLGLGMPFSNPGHQVKQWLEGGPVAGGKTLLDIIQAPVVRFVVKRPYGPFNKEWDEKLLPAPFEYPWGTDHTWDEDKFIELYDKYKGAQYPTARFFENDNNHISAMVHSMAQDVMWVVESAREIAADIHDAYFIEVRNKPPRAEYLAVVKLPLDYLDGYEAAWTRLTKDGTLEIDLYTPNDKELSGT
jgi:hypothetical protein